MSTPPMPGGPQGPQAPQGQPYPAAPQGQPYPAGPQGQQFPGAQQPYPGGAPGQQQYPGAGPVPGGGPVPGTGPMPQGANPGAYPPAPGQPQPFPQAPLTAPVKKKRGRLVAILTGVGVVVIGLIVKVALSFGLSTAVTSADDAHNTAVGECATVSGTTTKPNYEKVDCASGKQNYVVGIVLKSTDECPTDKGYDEYYEEGTLNNVKLCIAPVFEDGKCYDLVTTGGTTMGHPAIPCTDPNAIKIKVVKDKASASACTDPDPTHAIVYDPLKLTYCMSQPSGS
ncbi:hypothetical protein [Kutzneria buriramensis]|uniref:Collagen triple helix repeat protein n=1 Tax=Kutzneria buriramensis TaxID=1045776 RepID=A0A3E0HVA0_9PSEU|nr:hypothetical protein [Kutzneria buriramensis]REH50384.1 hypothetical protein BCF44_104663 [Kutzneria buriramensis]